MKRLSDLALGIFFVATATAQAQSLRAIDDFLTRSLDGIGTLAFAWAAAYFLNAYLKGKKDTK
jgi:hypothetical protein